MAQSSWTMRLSTSSLLYEKLGIERACQRVAKLGFRSIDIWAKFAHCTHLEEAKANYGPERTVKILSKAGLDLAAVSVYGTGYQPFAEFLDRMGGGTAVRGSEKKSSANLTAAMKAFLERLKPEIDLAAASHSRLAIENHSGEATLLNRLDSFKAFTDLNQSPHLGIALAPYHIQLNRESVEEAIRICGSQMFFFYAWQWGKGLAQLPGHGPTDFGPWIAALAKARYAGPVNIFLHGELEPDEVDSALTKSLAYMKECYSNTVK